MTSTPSTQLVSRRALENYELAEKTAGFYHAPGSRPTAVLQDLVWKSTQPGHMDISRNFTLQNMGWAMRSRRTVAWDGTFNMPTLVLSDANHRQAASIKFI